MRNSRSSGGQSAKHAHADEIAIDLRCAMAFGRSALRALAALSEDAADVVEDCLAEEIATLALEAPRGGDAVRLVLEDARAMLKGRSAELERQWRLEDQLIREALAIEQRVAG